MARFASLVVLAAIAAAPTAASADVFKLFGEVQGGGMYGKGTAGAQKDAAFFANSPHGAYGVLVGGELLFFDAWVQHQGFTTGSRVTTWTQFGLGMHFTWEMGTPEERKTHDNAYFEMGAGLWFGVGTGQQVMPPLDNAQITDKAFLGEGRLGFGKHLSSVFDLGVEVPASYGYFFKSGNGIAANDTNNHYRSFQIEGLVALRANLHIF